MESRICGSCGTTGASKLCGRCRTARYCSKQCQQKAWKDHKVECRRLAESNLAYNAAQRMNVFTEFKGINRLRKQRGGEWKNLYEKARWMMLKYIIVAVSNEPKMGDYPDDENLNRMVEAGKLLFEYDGMKGMRDPLVWLFLPRMFHREVDMYWNGIGEWRA